MKKPIILGILDGFGIEENIEKSAILQAKTPFIDSLYEKYPHSSLGASGEKVGLPDGQMGNSEVGHLNIGAGRIVYQELSRIGNEIKNGNFFTNKAFIDGINKAINKNKKVHIMGLISDGGVHSHIDHAKALLKLAKDLGAEDVFVHCFLDGRDVPPKSADMYLENLETYIKETKFGHIGSIAGRYYAMDRDNRWERVKEAYICLTEGSHLSFENVKDAINSAYDRDETDEFVKPSTVGKNSIIEEGDTVIMINFRPDRAREITRAFVDESFVGFERKKLDDLSFVTMTQYDKEIKNVSVAYPPEDILDTLGEVISDNGLSQLRIAETEKYAHVTFFFNGGKEDTYNGEDRILIPSPKVATYDLAPKMSGQEVTDKLVEVMGNYDLIILNFANPDMVGHTGNMKAAIEAIEAVDGFLKTIVNKLLEIGGKMLITADHGNADVMIDDEGKKVTAHSLNPVPIIYVGDEEVSLRKDGILADIAPTILELLGIDKPERMTGNSLFIK